MSLFKDLLSYLQNVEPNEIEIMNNKLKQFEIDIQYKTTLVIAKHICPFCNGTAIKSGAYNVLKIESVKPIVRSSPSPSSGQIRSFTWWEHRVQLEEYQSNIHGEIDWTNVLCYAHKIWEAVADLIMEKFTTNG